jgi:hypothetical protein
MTHILKTSGRLAALAAGVIFLGVSDVHAQFRTTATTPNQSGRTGNTNPNLFRQNLVRPVVQPLRSGSGTNFQQGNFNGVNPLIYPNSGFYPGSSYPGGYGGYYPGSYPGGYYPGMVYPGMTYPGFTFPGFGF